MFGKLGNFVDTLKGNAMDYVKLGVGATLGIIATDLAMSKVLVKSGVPIIPDKWASLAVAALGIVGGEMVKKYDRDLGTGVIAGTVGVAASSLAAKLIGPAVGAPAAASAAVQGFGNGRVFSGFGGYAAPALGAGGQSVYGVGTPDMSAARMFNGATVAFEENGAMAGAAVQFEENGFAGILS